MIEKTLNESKEDFFFFLFFFFLLYFFLSMAREGSWTCGACTLIHEEMTLTECSVCGTKRAVVLFDGNEGKNHLFELPKDVVGIICGFLKGGSGLLALGCSCKRMAELVFSTLAPWENGGRGMFQALLDRNWNYYIRAATVAGDRWDPSVQSCLALRYAAQNGGLVVVRMLLADPRVDPSCSASASLRKAAENGHLDVVMLLLQDGRADPEDELGYALRYACYNGHYAIVKALLDEGRADPSTCNFAALENAHVRGHHSIVALLVADARVPVSKKMAAGCVLC